MLKSKIISFGAAAFILAGCAYTPESLADEWLDVMKNHGAPEDEINKFDKANFSNVVKANCTKDEIQILGEGFSCLKKVRKDDNDAANKCNEITKKLKSGDKKCISAVGPLLGPQP